MGTLLGSFAQRLPPPAVIGVHREAVCKGPLARSDRVEGCREAVVQLSAGLGGIASPPAPFLEASQGLLAAAADLDEDAASAQGRGPDARPGPPRGTRPACVQNRREDDT